MSSYSAPLRSNIPVLDESIVPDLYTWRPFKREDLDGVIKLVNVSATKLFGTFDIEEMTEHSGHSVVVINKMNQIIAFVSLRNYPNIPPLLPEVWPEVLTNLYKANQLTFENTLFVHMLVCDRRYNWDFLFHVLRTLFMCMFRLLYVVIVIPPDGEQYFNFSGYTNKYFVKMLPRFGHSRKTVHESQKLYVTFRDQILPPLRIRYAVAEDNDDLVEILDFSSPKLKQQYGDFYIAEIVLDHESTRKMIVAELDNKVVGMLCLNSLESRKYLSRGFDIYAFNGFRKEPKDTLVESVSDQALNITVHSSLNTSGVLLPKKPGTNSNVVPEQTLSSTDSESEELSQSFRLSNSCMEQEAVSSNDYFWKLMKETEFLVSSSNMSINSSSEESSNFDTDTLDSYEKNKHKYLQQYSVHLHHTKSVDKDVGYESDVFLIELHCMHKEIDERRVLDLIVASFETFPNLSYCLIAFPTTTKYFPMLNYFVKLSTRAVSMSCPRNKIYLLQRNSLFSPIVLSLIQPDDEESLSNYLQSMYNGDNHKYFVLSAAKRFYNESESDVFPIVIRCLDTIIGVCVIQTYQFISRLKVHFQIETYIQSKHHARFNQVGMLQMMILHPAFMNRLPFIRAELFRLTGFTSLFFKLRDTSANAEIVVNTMLSEMVPVRPRVRMIYQTENLLEEQLPEQHILHSQLKRPYALYHQNIALCNKRKVPVNEQIVVVGCSSTAMSFLEELLFRKESQHVWFTSITMISPNGFAAVVFDDVSDLAKAFFFMQKYTPEYIRRLGFGAWVDVVFSSVVKIDRQSKQVYVTDGRFFQYDRLYLFCGLQFDYPINVRVPEHLPKNVAFLNNVREAELFVLRIKAMQLSSPESNIVVYGDSVHCYTCIDLLLQLQIDSKNITFIRPKAKENMVGCSTTFNDNFVDVFMEKLLQNSKIKVLEKYDIVDWVLDKENTVTKINVESDQSVLELQCSLFVCFERKIVARRTIRVLKEAGLVFDGRLVINSKCETNDPSIFSAGPMTKYRRILYADNSRHQYFSSMEIGARLGRRLFEELNPGRPFSAKMKVRTVPGTVHMYREPTIQYRPVLDGFRFLCIRMPGVPVPYELNQASDKYGIDLDTTQNNVHMDWGCKDVRYFRCHLNEYNRLATIVCLTREPIDVRLFIALYGQHESVLHSLRLRYEAHLIQDLYVHFSEPWIYVLYHDMYRTELNAKNLHVTLHHEDTYLNLNQETRENIIKNHYEKLTELQREDIVARFVTTSYRDMIQQNLVDFIKNQSEDLSMFTLPSKDTDP